jgi:carbamoyltransferase
MASHTESPYMLLVARVRSEHRVASGNGDLRGLDKLKLRRSDIPAVTHVDYSARVQTVDAERHGRFYHLVRAFERRTGCPVVINTSFNVRGEPIVCTPEQAYRCFMATNMDVLVLERAVLLKSDQPESRSFDGEDYITAFQPD